MKKLILALLVSGFITHITTAQDVATQLNDAYSSYDAGNLNESRIALQMALTEIDMAIGAEILKILPTSMNNMEVDTKDDNVTSTGFSGIFITRNYRSDEDNEYASIDIITDSPLLAGINAILALPVFMTDSNQKRIRVGGFRALLDKNEEGKNEEGEDTVSWSVQIPMGSTLLTFNINGPQDEKTVTDLVNTIKVDEINRLTR